MMVHAGDGATVLAAADAALVKSGTTTLEAALADTPMVVAYRVHPVTAAIARRLMTVPWISLVNLVAGRPVVPEVVQGGANRSALADLVRPLLDSNGEAARAQHAALAEVRARLGTPGAAERVVALAEELLAA
jgi:lipid-A-disaccharide synthase